MAESVKWWLGTWGVFPQIAIEPVPVSEFILPEPDWFLKDAATPGLVRGCLVSCDWFG